MVARTAESAYFGRRGGWRRPAECRCGRDQMATASAPITIKRYAGRRRYNPGMGANVALDELAAMVKDGEDFVVYEARTGKDIARSLQKQIIIERGSHG